MKTIKNILAYIDWSTYAFDSYSYPKTLCGLFWRTLFAICMAPVLWIQHAINVFLAKRYFSEGWQDTPKFPFPVGFLIHVGIFVFAVIADKILQGRFDINLLFKADNYIHAYGVVLVLGSVFAAIVAGALFIIGYICVSVVERMADRSNERKLQGKRTIVAKAYSAVKDKYCPMIDWSVIK